MTCVPALSTKVVRYLSFITPIPNGFGNVSQVTVERNRLVVHSDSRVKPVSVNASAVHDTLPLEN